MFEYSIDSQPFEHDENFLCGGDHDADQVTDGHDEGSCSEDKKEEGPKGDGGQEKKIEYCEVYLLVLLA